MAKRYKFQSKNKSTAKRKSTNSRKIKISSVMLESLRFNRVNFNMMVKLSLVVALPASLFALFTQNDVGSDTNLLTSIAGIYSVMAIAWSVFYIEKANKEKLSQIYTTVSGRFLQVFTALLFVTITAFPASLVLLVTLALLIAFPQFSIPIWSSSVLLLFFTLLIPARYSLAVPIAVSSKYSAFRSLKESAKAMKGYKIRTLMAYGVILIVIGFVVVASFQLLSILLKGQSDSIINALLNAIYLTLFMPYIVIFTVKLYEKLSEQNPITKSS